MDAKKITITAVTGSVAFFAGLLLASGGLRSGFLKTFALSGLLTVPTMFVAHLVIDTRATNKINRAEQKTDEATKALLRAKSQVSELERVNAELSSELAKVKEALTVADGNRAKLAGIIATLDPVAAKLEASAKASQQRIEELELEIEAWEVEFYNRVATEAEKRFKEAKAAEIQKIFEEHDAVTREAMQLFRELQGWGQRVAHGHSTKREIIVNLATQYNRNLDEISASLERERATYLEQIELLNEKVARLQHELNGDLLEPEYLKAGYQWDARIVDDIARHIWAELHIPLAVKGYKSNSDGSAEGGYGYSRSQSPEALVRDLSRLSGDIAKALGIHAVTSVQKHELSELLIIQWRCERLKPLKDDEIYRILKPSSTSLKLIREATDHKKGGKPTLRIMGATGEGKGIIARALLADWVKYESGEVWLSDPVDGSDEDRWECPKVARSSREARQLLKEYVGEFENRKNKVSSRKDVQVLALFDEFDKEHPKEDKELVKGIWTAIRHHKMRLILMGQSSEVGSNGWQWDEMNNCACLFVGSGISTAIKHAKDLGISRATASQLEAQKDQIMTWLDSKNQGLDAGSQYRVALLVIGEKARFLELPMAYEGAIENGKSVLVSHPWESLSDETKPTISESRVCPGCGSKLRKAGSKLRCENRDHTKEMGKKTFDLD